MIKTANETNFKDVVQNNDKPVLVDFWASWCGPCLRMNPVLEEISNTRTDVEIIKINVDENPVLSSQYNIMSIPTMMLFKKGEIKAINTGSMPSNQLNKFLDDNLN